MKSNDHPDIFDYLKAIPDFNEKGVKVYSKCPCGGTLTSIRVKYNGHLHVRCDKCKFVLHE